MHDRMTTARHRRPFCPPASADSLLMGLATPPIATGQVGLAPQPPPAISVAQNRLVRFVQWKQRRGNTH
jgi:hypothetical protein